MSNKQEPKPTQPIPQTQKTQQPSNTVSISSIFQSKQNHLSASHQQLLFYEQRNYEIQDATRDAQITKQLVQKHVSEPFELSKLKNQQIFSKYGSMIENQPMFLREIVFKNYLPYVPTKFQDQFSQIMLIGTGFEFLWWGSLAFAVFRAFKNRRLQAEQTFREKAFKGLGVGFLFLLSSLGFYEEYYTPRLKKCYYSNIKTLDTMMSTHIKILKSTGAQISQELPLKQPNTTPPVVKLTQAKKQPIPNPTKQQDTKKSK